MCNSENDNEPNPVEQPKQEKWKRTVILADADYADSVAFDLTVNFERMLGRRIPPADLARWLVCVALDGGVTGPDEEVQVVLMHAKGRTGLDNFVPSAYADIDGKAFREEGLGEFLMSALPDEAPAEDEALYVQALDVLVNAEEVKRLILVPDLLRYGEAVRKSLHEVKDCDVTLLAMEPQAGHTLRSEILGYSLMSALGIRGEELG